MWGKICGRLLWTVREIAMDSDGSAKRSRTPKQRSRDKSSSTSATASKPNQATVAPTQIDEPSKANHVIDKQPPHPPKKDTSPPRSPTPKNKGKGKRPRQKKTNSLMEEDIIDSFAIMSFQTFDDLEVSVVCLTQ